METAVIGIIDVLVAVIASVTGVGILTNRAIDKLDRRITALGRDLHGEIDKVRSDVRCEIDKVRTDLSGEVGKVRGEMEKFRTELSGDIEGLRAGVTEMRVRTTDRVARLEGHVFGAARPEGAETV